MATEDYVGIPVDGWDKAQAQGQFAVGSVVDLGAGQQQQAKANFYRETGPGAGKTDRLNSGWVSVPKSEPKPKLIIITVASNSIKQSELNAAVKVIEESGYRVAILGYNPNMGIPPNVTVLE